MIFIFYPSMIVKDVLRNSVFCQTITFHWGKVVTLQRYALSPVPIQRQEMPRLHSCF